MVNSTESEEITAFILLPWIYACAKIFAYLVSIYQNCIHNISQVYLVSF